MACQLMKLRESLNVVYVGRSLVMGKQIIKVNRARCDACGIILTSNGAEDKQICRCKNLMIGGGTVELFRNALYISQMTEMSEFEYDPLAKDDD
jgi:hypothetical protein